jgi:hypothetical protein
MSFVEDRNYVELVLSEEDAGSDSVWNLIVPDGTVDSENGQFVLDGKGAKSVIGIFDSRQVDVVVDYNHTSMPALAPSDGIAPAAGWIKQLSYVEGKGLLGRVRWTDRAREMIRAREFRYLSPTVWLDKETRHVGRLDSAALTHKPAIRGGLPVAASRSHIVEAMDMPTKKQTNQEGTEGGEVTPDQKLGQIAELLKGKGVDLAEGAGIVAVLDAVIALLRGESGGSEEGTSEEGGGEVANAVRQALGLGEDAGKDEILMTLSRQKEKAAAQPNATKMQARLDELEKNEATRNAHTLRDRFVQENKINPDNKEIMANALEWAARDAEAFTKYHESLDALLPAGRTTAPNVPPASKGDGKEEELIANAVKEHDGNYGDAMVALQTKLIAKESERTGLQRKLVVNRLTEQYPKIFGEAA